tara:strand:+ start:7226 stop:8815 length:1590 start_codon:yes stop_codon:yes gene_type:complete
MSRSFDYIVIGGGSAGCVVTNRLVKAGHTVLLLEEGPADNSIFVHIPATFIRVLGTKRTFVYRAEEAQSTGGRALYVPQGRTLGGGSSVNAMIYIRGQARDYDDWEAMGCTGWGWKHVLPVFRDCESNERLSNDFHGTSGPLAVSDPRFRHPLSLAFVKAAQEAGYSYNHDFNGAAQAGTGFYQTTTRNAQRGSTAATFLAEVRTSKNLTIETDAPVERIEIKDGRATGVTYRSKSGALQTATAHKEIILTAGALASPKLLMLSGIGPAMELQKHGIAVYHDAPEVGQNFQDHLEVPAQARTRDPISLLGSDRGWKAIRHGLQYLMFRTGQLASTVVESGAFIDTGDDGRPDTQINVLPILTGDVDREPLPGHGVTLNPCQLRPESRGEVRLRSSNPADPILFDGRYLSDDRDMAAMVRGLKAARNILRQPALAALTTPEILPSPDIDLPDKDLADHVRNYAKTVYHPSCTCRMGSDERSVVDPTLRVRGVENLRVCDASVMPKLVSGNTNAPTIMIASRCADFILAGS